MKQNYQKSSVNRNSHGGNSRFPGQRDTSHSGDSKKVTPPPLLENGVVRIIPTGGVEEIGRNMTIIEHAEDIFVVDVGLSSKDSEIPGVEFILPNTKYLQEKANHVRAIFAMNSHADHIGGIPYLAASMGNPPIFARLITAVLIKKQQELFPKSPALEIRVIEKDQSVKIGNHIVHFFGVTKELPDALGIRIETPYGDIVHTGNLRLTHTDNHITKDWGVIFSQFSDTKTLCLLSDSINTEKPGFSIPESQVMKNIDELMEKATGRIIFGAFPAQITRLLHIIDTAIRLNKKIAVEGKSMRRNMDVVNELVMHKHPASNFIRTEEISKYQPEEIVILATGGEGNEYSELIKAASNQHRSISITEGDTIILSSSTISGFERSIQKLKDLLSREGARIVHYQASDVNASSHAHKEEATLFIRKTHPQFFVPISGHHYMLTVHAELARTLAIPESNIAIPQNGSVIEIRDNGTSIHTLREKAPYAKVLVDGISVGEVQEVVIKDRQMLAEDGMFVIVAVIDGASGQLRKSPDIISRGFVYLKESQALLREARTIIKKSLEDQTTKTGPHTLDVDELKQIVTNDISKFLLQKTAKRPVVIPVILNI